MYVSYKQVGHTEISWGHKHEQCRCNPLFEYQWMSFLEETSPSETLKAALRDKEGRKEETGEGCFLPSKILELLLQVLRYV